MRTGRNAALAAVVVVALSACGGDDEGAGELRDADEAERDEAADTAVDGEIGEPVNVGEHVVTVTAIDFDSTDTADSAYSGTIVVELRTENPTDEELGSLDFKVVCANSDETGRWYADSTYAMNDSFPPESFREGDLILGVPIDCADPAVRAAPTGLFMDGEQVFADWAVPDEVAQRFE